MYFSRIMSLLISNIRLLVNVRETQQLLRGKGLGELPVIKNGFLIIEDGVIAAYGKMEELSLKPSQFAFHYSAEGRAVLPSWCDSHTHIVFAGSREHEFVDKIWGLTYAEIAAKGGGILNSAKKLKETSEEDLFQQSYKRLKEVIRL